MRGDRRFPEADERLNLQSLGRALDVLEIYSVDPTPKSLGEIARLAGITKSAAQRVAQSLLSRGYLEHSAQGGLAPGRILLERAFDYLRTNPLIERAAPILTDLRKMSGERVDLSLFDARHDNLAIVYALRMQNKRETFYATLAGRRMPTYAAAGGRCCLACLPDEAVDDILARSTLLPITPKTLIEPDAIRERMAQAREEGYAFCQEEALLGEVVVAAAIRNSGQPIGAVHIAGSLSDWTTADFRRRFAPLVMESARALSI